MADWHYVEGVAVLTTTRRFRVFAYVRADADKAADLLADAVADEDQRSRLQWAEALTDYSEDADDGDEPAFAWASVRVEAMCALCDGADLAGCPCQTKAEVPRG